MVEGGNEIAHRLKIYLRGPIRGCSDEQKTWWREEAKQMLRRDFYFEDPTEWADDRVTSLEIAKLETCDALLANMWKESIGTTLGIVRARHQGKPRWQVVGYYNAAPLPVQTGGRPAAAGAVGLPLADL